jgi:Flp pilus assembly pilin Flp
MRRGRVTFEKPKFGYRQEGVLNMKRLMELAIRVQVWKDRKGQDLIEYALMAGFVAVAAGAIMPGVASSISTIFTRVNSIMAEAAK